MRLVPRRPNRKLARDLDAATLRLRSLGPLRTLLFMAPWRRDAELMSGLTFHAAPRPLFNWLEYAPRLPNNLTRFAYAIVPRGERRPVGLALMGLEADGSAGGYLAISDPRWRGTGVAAEARAALLELFFRDGGVTKFIASVDSRNAGSVFVYKRLGFRAIRTLVHAETDPVTGRVIDKIVFELTREEWERRHVAAMASAGT